MNDELLPELARVQSRGGATFVVRVLRAPEPGRPVAAILPAMGTPARFYLPLSRSLHEEGLSVVTVDLRGQGESRPRAARGVRFGYREMLEDDLPTVLDAVRAELPGAPVVLLGHSLGGQLGLLYAATAEVPVDAVVLVASGSVWWRAYGLRGPEKLAGTHLLAGVAAALGYWPGRRLGFGGNQPGGVMRDWARQARTGRYTPTGSSVDYERALADLTLPVLVVGVDQDTFAPARSREHLAGKVPRATVGRWQYTRDAAEGKAVDHFRWVRHHTGLVPYLAAWMLKVAEATDGHEVPPTA